MSSSYDRMFRGANEKFVGTKKNEEKHEQYKKLLACAKQLANGSDIFNTFVLDAGDPNDNKSQNCMLYIDAESPILLIDEGKRLWLAQMIHLCDVFTTAVTEDGQHIRYAFGVNNVWTE